jgi:hypothetical protein
MLNNHPLAMPYDMRLDLAYQMNIDSSAEALTRNERAAFAVPTLHGEEIQHSHAGNADVGEQFWESEYDADYNDDGGINEAGLEDIVQQPRYNIKSPSIKF